MRTAISKLRQELAEDYVTPPPGRYLCPNCGGSRKDVENAPCEYCLKTGHVYVFRDGDIRAASAAGPLRGYSPLRRREALAPMGAREEDGRM